MFRESGVAAALHEAAHRAMQFLVQTLDGNTTYRLFTAGLILRASRVQVDDIWSVWQFIGISDSDKSL